MKRAPLITDNPATPYNVVVASPVKGQPPHQPMRALVAAMRALTVLPWLAETSLEDVVLLWQDVRRESEVQK